MRLNQLASLLKGGPGSGNFGHSGRPGERGGSSSSGSVSLPSGQKLDFVLSPQQKYHKDKLVKVPVKTIEEAWQGGANYIPPGKEDIPGRRQRFEEFLQTGKPIHPPSVYIDENGRVDFTDGRHRYAVLRERGLKEIYIAVPKSAQPNIHLLRKGLVMSLKNLTSKLKNPGLSKVTDLLKGGPGSGNFGHAGRPGERGGSGGGGSSDGGKGLVRQRISAAKDKARSGDLKGAGRDLLRVAQSSHRIQNVLMNRNLFGSFISSIDGEAGATNRFFEGKTTVSSPRSRGSIIRAANILDRVARSLK